MHYTVQYIVIRYIFGLFMLAPVVLANDLAVLSGILRTYQVSACDNELLSVECDSRTVVSIVVADYGRPKTRKLMCKSSFQRNMTHMMTNSVVPSQSSATTRTLSTDLIDHKVANDICPSANHLRDLFLRKIELVCREQNRCTLLMTPTTLGIPKDPCGHLVKYAELAYKCRPNKFINKILCEGLSMTVSCNEDDRIVILSAFFGATAMGVTECPNTSTLKSINNNNSWNMSLAQLHSSCQVNNAKETVMNLCLGRRNCTITSDTDTFGVPYCPMKVRNFLKVVYTCTSRKMLQSSVDLDTTTTTTTTTATTIITTVKPSGTTVGSNRFDTKVSMQNRAQHYNDDDMKKNVVMDQSSVPMDLENYAGTRTQPPNCTLSKSVQVVGFVSEWISAIDFLKKNRERLILYLLVSLFGSLLCFLVVLSSKLYAQKSAAMRKVRESQLPPTPFEIIDFDDDIIDEDMIHPRYRSDSLEIHRQPYTMAPNTAVSVLTTQATEPRPLLYSTLRHKSRPVLKYKDSNDYSGSRHSNSHYSPSPLSTLPKSILTNRNSLNGTQARETKNDFRNSTCDYGGSVASFNTTTNTSNGKKKSLLQKLNGNGNDKQTDTGGNKSADGEEDEESTQPRMSKSLNNFFL